MFDKLYIITMLFDFYGQLLTQKQQETFKLYYNNDLSLKEISEQMNISRQAVYDTLKKTEKVLNEYENKLQLVKRFIDTKHSIKEIIKILEDIEISNDISYVKNKVIMLKDFTYKLIDD